MLDLPGPGDGLLDTAITVRRVTWAESGGDNVSPGAKEQRDDEETQD
jgi:hypothetical protein